MQAQSIDDQKAATDELIQLYDALSADPATPPSILNDIAKMINDSLAILDPAGFCYSVCKFKRDHLKTFIAGSVQRKPILREFFENIHRRKN